MQFEAEHSTHGRLYLNIGNPAPCNGVVNIWTYCYYNDLGSNDDTELHEAHFAIYRQIDSFNNENTDNLRYKRLSESAFTMSQFINERELSDFRCSSFVHNVTIEQGDVIEVCLPKINQLIIVSDTSGANRSAGDASVASMNCNSKNTHNKIRGSRLDESRNTLVHLYAEIMCKSINAMLFIASVRH